MLKKILIDEADMNTIKAMFSEASKHINNRELLDKASITLGSITTQFEKIKP